jgi:hypothetical protein
MSDKSSVNRRSILKKTGRAGFGITGLVGATGTASAIEDCSFGWSNYTDSDSEYYTTRDYDLEVQSSLDVDACSDLSDFDTNLRADTTTIARVIPVGYGSVEADEISIYSELEFLGSEVTISSGSSSYDETETSIIFNPDSPYTNTTEERFDFSGIEGQADSWDGVVLKDTISFTIGNESYTLRTRSTTN